MRPAKAELLTKVIAWRMFSMLYSFTVAYMFTSDAGESAGIVILTGSTLTVLQWGFEITWDSKVRNRLRELISKIF